MRQKNLDDEAANSKQRFQQRSPDSAVEDSNREREPLVIVEANLIEVPFPLLQIFKQLLFLDCG